MIIKSNNIYSDNGFYNGQLVITDGKIAEDSKSRDEIIDFGDKYIVPGFIDIHIHGAMLADFTDGSVETVKTITKYTAKHGTTSLLATTVTDSMERTRNALKSVKEYNNISCPNASKVAGVHIEGPYLNKIKKGAQPEQYILPPSIENYDKLVEGYEDIIKQITLAPEIDGALPLIKYLKEKEITVSMGHTTASYEESVAGFDAGISHMTHFYNAMSSLGHREPGAVGAALDNDKITIELIADNVHLHKSAMNIAITVKGRDKTALITDSMQAAGLGDGEYTLGSRKVNVIDGQARIPEGNLAGSILTQDIALKNLIDEGYALEDIIPMLTSTPADIAGLDLGRLIIGKPADIVVLNEDYSIYKVMIDGHWVMEK